MKKLHLISVSLLFAALGLIFTACNQGLTAGQGTGTVRIVIDSGATRAVNAEGMPRFDESNTVITVTGEDGAELKKASGTTPITLTLAIGKKITVTVVVKTDAGKWRGTKEHTITEGTNTVAVKLSKVPLNVGNILSNVELGNPLDPTITLKLARGKELAANVNITRSSSGNYLKRPVIARDSSGRIYMLYDKGSRKLTRFDAEGNLHCEIPLKTLLPSSRISTMTVDAKTNTIFVFDGNSTNIYALTESSPNVFTPSAPFDISTLPTAASPGTAVTAAAAYNNVLFLVTTANKLIACTVTLSGTSLSLTEKNVATLENLRGAISGSGVFAKCTGLFADENNIYCLLREQKSDASQLYMIGALIRYTYSGGTLADKKVIGLHSQASMPRYRSLTFEEHAFVNPVGFIGYDEEFLYIADDGAEIRENSYIGFYAAGNKDRIAAFRRDNMELVFDDSGTPTWFAEYTAQYEPKIPNVLWSKEGSSGVKFELNIDGTKKTLGLAIPASNIRYAKTARDSAGSVYVLYRDNATPSALYLERFAADGTKDTTFGSAKSEFTWPKKNDGTDDTEYGMGVSEIAVDFKTGDVFLLKRIGTTITAYMAKKADEGYTSFSAAKTVTTPSCPGNRSIDSVAAFDGTLFVAMDVQGTPDQKKLYAYKMETASIGSFAFTGASADAELRALRPAATLDKRTCTGLFADGKGVYALLTQQDPYSGAAPYALGQVVRFSYNGSTLTEDISVPNSGGLNPAASGTGSVPYNAAHLSNPAGFIGYDGDTLYFADDGINIEDINENYRVNGNKDRIMAFNRKDKTVSAPSISIDGVAWSETCDPYNKPETKVLLWEKDFSSAPTYQGVRYWVNDNVSTAYPGVGEALWESTDPAKSPTDVFCYDQDGNLYILYVDTTSLPPSSQPKFVRRFILRDGAYDKADAATPNQNLALPAGIDVNAIAVDVSDGNHYLYYAGTNKVERYRWSGTFSGTPPTPGYSITMPGGEEVTALTANRDGVFVATKEQVLPTNPYTLRIRKYKSGTEDGHAVIVNNASAFDSHSAHAPYNTYDETIHDLQVVNGVLYSVTSRITKTMKEVSGTYRSNEFRSNGFLYKVGNTKDSFSGTGAELYKQEADEAAQTGYGFHRFIAVKPKKLVIASDGAYGTNGADSSHTEKDTNSVFEFDLDGHLQNGENGKKAEATFSKKLTWSFGCSFGW